MTAPVALPAEAHARIAELVAAAPPIPAGAADLIRRVFAGRITTRPAA